MRHDRNYRKYVLACLMAGLSLGPWIAEPTHAGTKPLEGTYPPIKAGKPYAGQTVRLAMQAGWTAFKQVLDRLSEFEEMTGIRVVVDSVPASDMQRKQLIEVSQSTGTYSLVAGNANEFRAFDKWTIPLTPYVNETWGDPEKFMGFLWPIHRDTLVGGQIHYVAFHANTQLGFYYKKPFTDPKNKASFKAKYGYDLEIPSSLSQVQDIANFFTGGGKYGFTANWGGGGPGYISWVDYYMKSTGTRLIDDGFNVTFSQGKNREVAIRVAAFQQDALHKAKFANPDTVTFNTGMVADYFMSGKAVMAYGWLTDYWPQMQRPEFRAEHGEVGAFPFPPLDPAIRAGGYVSWWNIGIPKDSKSPGAAWEFIKWLLNDKQQRPMATVGGQLPPIPEMAAKFANQGVIPRAQYDSFVAAKRLWITIPEQALELRSKGVELHSAMLANKISPEEFVDRFARETEGLIKQRGYKK